MPDGRLRDGNGYSTHPPTVRTRQRLANLPAAELNDHKARSAECSSIWAACSRVSKTDKYKKANVNHRRQILLHHISALFEKRGNKGKERFGVNEEAIVEKHLKKEAAERKFFQSRNKDDYKVSLKGISVDQGEDVPADLFDVDGDGMEGIDDAPLPFKMSPSSNADNRGPDQSVHSELLAIIARLEHKVDRLYHKVDTLSYQILHNRVMEQQRGSHFAGMPAPPTFTHPALVSGPTMPPNNDMEAQEPEETPNDSGFYDEGYASPSQDGHPPGHEGHSGQQDHQAPLFHSTGFDMPAQETLVKGQKHPSAPYFSHHFPLLQCRSNEPPGNGLF